MQRRTAKGSVQMSCPATVAVPEAGRANVVSIWIVVVLPAPLCPRKPKISPLAMSIDRASTAVTPSKDWVSRFNRIMGSDIVGFLLRVALPRGLDEPCLPARPLRRLSRNLQYCKTAIFSRRFYNLKRRELWVDFPRA